MPGVPPPPPQGPTGPGQPPYGTPLPEYRPARPGRVVSIILGLVLVSLLLLGGFILWVFSLVRNSSATATAVAAASRDGRVVAITGLPLKTGWFVSGHVNVQGEGGDATLTIPVSGPHGRGNIYAVERNGFAGWTPTTLEFWPAENPNAIVRIVEPGAATVQPR